MSFTPVTVTGNVLNPDSTPAIGITVQWSLTQTVVDTSGGSFLTAAPIAATTDSNGDWSITVGATDDATTDPQGQVYRVEIQIPSASPNGVYVSGTYYPTYYVAVPSASAPTVDFAQLLSTRPLPHYVGPT